MPDSKRIVESGYDAIAERYGVWQKSVQGSPRMEWLELLLRRLPEQPDVLELGCGAGVHSTRLLAARGRLVGVDISVEQIRRARERVPEATFIHGDLAAVEFETGSFDAVVSLYALGHVPRDELAEVFPRIARWLRPGGHLLATTGSRDDPGTVEEDWLGAPMFFSSHDSATNLRLLTGAGLEVVKHEVVCQEEPEVGTACFLWVLARRPQ